MADAPSSAVFLSYASQDAEAVRRIVEALRAAGVEVWFDQNELVGGDAWDQKIRRQIKECALFVPVISAATQARGEGYFRLEWKLAVDRSHLMAPDQPFLLPVVIDDTADAVARVADEFRAVQWTRLPAGETTPAFCARVKKLLGGEGSPVSERSADVGARLARAQEDRRGPAASLQKPARPWLGPAILGVAAVAALAFWQPWRGKAPTASAASAAVAAAAPISEARKLAAKADAMFDQLENASHEDLLAAEQFLKKALALDQNDSEIWAIYSRLCVNLLGQQFELSEERVALAGNAADRALRLAPQSFEARLALANFYRLGRGPQSMVEEAERTLRELVALQPMNKRAWRILGLTLRGNTGSTEGRRLGRYDEAVSYYDRAAALPGGDPLALHNKAQLLMIMGRSEEAEATIDQVLALHPNGSSYLVKVTLLLIGRGDWRQAKEVLAKVPVSWLREDTGAAIAYQVWSCAREPDKALEALRAVPRDYIQATMSWGPKAFLAGQAQRLAKRDAAAQVEWRAAQQLVDGRLAKNSNDIVLLRLKARLLACLGESGEAEKALRTVEQLAGGNAGEITLDTALTYLEIGKREEVIAWVPTELAKPWNFALPITRAYLRINPQWDPLRGDPRFQALIDAAPAPEEKKESKPTTATPAPTVNEKSLVVLPLENLSPDPENAFFTEGMHLEIIATLQRALPDLKVISRDSALALKGTGGSLAEKAQKVGVAHVITGSVRRDEAGVRVHLELRRARDEELLWTQTYAKKLGEGLIAIQSDIADQVARLLQARERKGTYAGAQFMTANPEAYDLFLKASKTLYTDRSPTGRQKAIAGLEQALAIDPRFSSAAQLLSSAKLTAFRETRDPTARLRLAHEAKHWAEETSRLLPGGAGDAALASYYSFIEPDSARALALGENAVRALPNDAAVQSLLGLVLTRAGRTADSVVVFRRATTLDPFNQLFRSNLVTQLTQLRRVSEAATAESDFVAVAEPYFARPRVDSRRFQLTGNLPSTLEAYRGLELADWLVRARHYEEALLPIEAEISAATGGEAERWRALIKKCDVLCRLRREPEALAAAQTAQESVVKLNAEPEFDLSERDLRLAVTLARLGRADEAVAAGRRYVEARSAENQVRSRWNRETELAEIYAYLRRPRECAQLLATLLRVPSDISVPMLKVDPAWDNVREDAGFKALLADPKNSAPL